MYHLETSYFLRVSLSLFLSFFSLSLLQGHNCCLPVRSKDLGITILDSKNNNKEIERRQNEEQKKNARD